MFTEISMTNFKSWRDTGAVRMAPLTAFFGANSSGKSSLLQMLLLLKQTAESNDRNLVLKTGSIQPGYVNLGTPHEITLRDETKMSFGVSWDVQERYEFSIPVPNSDAQLSVTRLAFQTQIHAEKDRVYVQSLEYRQDNEFVVKFRRAGNNRYLIRIYINGVEPKRPQSRPRIYMNPEKCYGFSYEALSYYQDTFYLRNLELLLESQLRRTYYLGPLREYPLRAYTWGGEKPTDVGLKGELAVHALLAGTHPEVSSGGRRNRLQPRIARLLKDLGLARSFDVRPLFEGSNQYAVWMKRKQTSPEVLIPDLGIGISQVLPVLVLCYYVPEGSTIILEQPELHLHPSVQAGLAEVIIDVIKNRNIQVIVESHSEHFLRRLQLLIAEQKINRDQTALYFCEMESGWSNLMPLEVDLFGTIHNWPKDFFGDLTGDVIKIVKANRSRKSNSSNAS
ncbi:MAG: DUF3696 domain-containing protein [Chloroflexi bacterium]|nr:DUF3696 domain-containing protein [Chloroflexota bacterium]